MGAVNENAVSRKQCMRENRQSSARRLARPALSSTERDILVASAHDDHIGFKGQHPLEGEPCERECAPS